MLMSRSLALILVMVGLPVLAQEQPQPSQLLSKQLQDNLKERDRVRQEAKRQRAAGHLTEAIAAGEKVLAIEREVFGNIHPDVAGSLQFLAEMHAGREDFPAARQARQEVLAIQTKLLGRRHWQVT